MRSGSFVVAIVLSLCLSITAHADRPAGDACSASLTPDGKAIYGATMAAGPTTGTMRSVLEEQARGLVMGGKIARGQARENAVAAGECVKTALQ
jgi:hypothetical protein